MSRPVPPPSAPSPILIRTTLPRLPYPPFPLRPPILTPRLLLRSPSPADLPALHALRTQPAVMQWTATGKPDADLDATRTRLDAWLREAHNYNTVICRRETGEVVGSGGSHVRRGELGWPEVGYMLRREEWGRGYGTEFLRGFLGFWWTLEREVVELSVDRDTLGGKGEGVEEGERVEERIVALTVEENTASRGVLGKAGMELVKVAVEDDLRDLEKKVLLFYYVGKGPGEEESTVGEVGEVVQVGAGDANE